MYGPLRWGILAAGLALPATLSAQEYPADMTRGKAVYERHCATCHGAGGWGDGPQAANLKTRPANFHRSLSYLKSDEELLKTIESGSPGTPMAAWENTLSPQQMQDVLAYVRSFGK